MRIQITVSAYYPRETLPENLLAGVLEEIRKHLQAYGFTVSDINTEER